MRGRWLTLALGSAAWVLAAGLLANVLLRIVAHDRLWITIVLNAMTPYLPLAAYPVLAFAVWQRRHALTAVAGMVVLCELFWTFEPLARVEHPSPRSDLERVAKPFRIFSANVLAWNASTEGIVEEIMQSDADVVAVQELSPRWANAFARPRFARVYPYRIEEVRKDAFGTAIYAREPLLESDILTTSAMPIARATVRIDGMPIRIYSVHSPPPARAQWVALWSRGLSEVESAARRETLPVVLAGDFNATQHSAWYLRFAAGGFRSSHDACGRPFATSWPNGMLRVPSLRLDHVFLPRELACVAVREGIGAGSDHQPIIVDMRRIDPGA